MTNYYVYPDGTITEEPLEFMSDDYYVLEAQDHEEAYEMALMLWVDLEFACNINKYMI